MKKNDLIKLAKEGKLEITKYWYNTHFLHGARTDDMGKGESYQISSKDFDEFIKLRCKLFNL